MHFSARSGSPRPLRAPLLARPALAAAAVAAITLSVTALGTPASAATATAASVIKEAKAAIAAQSSAHLEFDAGSSSSSSTEKIVADVGTTGAPRRSRTARRFSTSR